MTAASAGVLATNLTAARWQMGFSLGWHIVLASLGVAFPALIVTAEWWGQRRGDPVALLLARRWAKTLAVLFAVGAVSGTIISFEMGILWPRFMSTWGPVFGFPFTLEGIAFFIEAIFLGVYLYGWDRLSPRAHLATGIPIAIAGLSSAWFVVCANAWMNSPTGFRLEHGRLVATNPWAALVNPATPTETSHMILAAYLTSGFLISSVYAAGILRGKASSYHQLAFRLSFGVAAALTPVMGIDGDLSARYVSVYQPVKLAAMEAVPRTASGVAETIGGILLHGRVVGGLTVPDGLSLLDRFNPHARIRGLNAAPPGLRPPVNIVHPAFDLMTLIGFALFALALWGAWLAWRRRPLERSRWFLRAALLGGPAAIIAVEAGWIVTELGRQPWIVYQHMTVAQAVNPEPGLWTGLWAVLALYTVLTVVLGYVLRRLARVPLPADPTEADVEAVQVVLWPRRSWSSPGSA
ncbi:MAG TPA: cytochrome ubiquinol oxidase subunit I [Streptosporangiaceae bacterium]|jgi:cytochrome d ubiquinol oxidase subunit I